MLASLMTIGRRKTTSSVLVLLRFRELKMEPMIGMLLRIGTVSSTSLIESSIRPPSTAICPLFTLIRDSISRMRSCGTRFGVFGGIAGLGSVTNLISRVVDGLTLSRMVSSSLIWGVTFITNPTGTVTGVVVTALITFDPVAPVVVWLDWTL